ncbi:MAG TPA: hypothetical protein VN619_08755 [Lacisediminihabitans sp.]|nr:hypothetical protein [Lacisediminihabitans sp.]HXD62002.1 hypothetical protein [Lacisediminihabitans sp.]
MSAANGGGPLSSTESAARRRTIIIVVAIIVVVLAAVAILAAIGFGGAARQHRAATTSSPTPRASASETPIPQATATSTTPAPDATADPRFGAPVAQTVPKDASADFGDTVTARITSITSTTATGTGVGEVSGPAVRVALSITNGTGSQISLNGVTVNAYYGSAMTPASPVGTQDDKTFGGNLGASKTASGSYEFSVPKDQQSSLVITVSRAAGEPIVVFQG